MAVPEDALRQSAARDSLHYSGSTRRSGQAQRRVPIARQAPALCRRTTRASSLRLGSDGGGQSWYGDTPQRGMASISAGAGRHYPPHAGAAAQGPASRPAWRRRQPGRATGARIPRGPHPSIRTLSSNRSSPSGGRSRWSKRPGAPPDSGALRSVVGVLTSPRDIAASASPSCPSLLEMLTVGGRDEKKGEHLSAFRYCCHDATGFEWIRPHCSAMAMATGGDVDVNHVLPTCLRRRICTGWPHWPFPGSHGLHTSPLGGSASVTSWRHDSVLDLEERRCWTSRPSSTNRAAQVRAACRLPPMRVQRVGRKEMIDEREGDVDMWSARQVVHLDRNLAHVHTKSIRRHTL
jgi:hypothetical protein